MFNLRDDEIMRYLILVLVCLALLLTACASENEQYYRLHPKALQEALKHCPASPRKVTCAELARIAEEVNSLAYQLQMDPQGFAHRILALQTKLAELESDLIKNTTKSDFDEKRLEIEQDKQKLAEYFAVVRWLESPEK